MVALIKFISDFSLWFYLVLGLVAFVVFLAVRASARERAQSIFDLERERATARLSRNLGYLFITLLFIGVIFYVDSTLINQVPLPEETPTPTVLVVLPSTPTSPPLLPTPTSTLTPTPRVVLEPQVSVNISSTPSPTTVNSGTTPNCPIPGNTIIQPGNNATISGVTPLIGAASVANFSYYKIEFRIPGQNWNFIESHETPVGTGQIASWNTATVPPGDYDLRLVVVDETGNFLEPCQVRVTVVR